MIDFTKKIKSSDKFRQPALTYIATGSYCNHPRNSSEYYRYWDEEKQRCLHGYTAEDGDYITGFNYFYLNYCPIIRQVTEDLVDRFGNVKRRKIRKKYFPAFWDYDYYYFLCIEEAQDNGKHLCVLKSRRKGYSFKAASMLNRNYFLIPESKSYVYASSKEYLIGDGILTKAWDIMNFIDKETAWGKKRTVNRTLHKRSGVFIKDEYGNEIEGGYKSEIIGATLKDNPDIVRGKGGQLIFFEEAGSFTELGEAWQIARPSVEEDGVAFGLMVAYGTGGDPGSRFATLKDMFYNPDAYNCLGLDNIWDEIPTDKKCGFFIPQHTNIMDVDDNDNYLYMDKDGNTLYQRSLERVLELRRDVIQNSTSSTAVDRYVAERPVTPREAMLDFAGNIFPKKELENHLSYIRMNKSVQNHKQVGDLVWGEDGKVKWHIKKGGDIQVYPLNKDDDPTGAIVIWEHPMEEPPSGLYILGVDPYDHDQAGTNSLGSTFVYKRFQGFEEYYDLIVAEYTGRPATAEEYYENVRKLAIYYNGRIMYENERKGIFPYFTAKHCDYLLADQPDIISDIVKNSTVQRKKGCHLNKQIKDWAEGMLKDWLNEEYAPGHKNLKKILSEPLLEELIRYNDKDNFDRVCAMFQVMIYKEQLHNVIVKEKTKENRDRQLFDGPLFKFNEDDLFDSPTNDENVFTFNFNYI